MDALKYYWNWVKGGFNWMTFGVFDPDTYESAEETDKNPIVNWTRVIIILGIVVLLILFVFKPLINSIRKK